PDGQTPIDYLDLESVGRVEAIRGTASALYGNASGGVLDLRSPEPSNVPFAVQARAWGGGATLPGYSGTRRYAGLHRYRGLCSGSAGSFGYEGNLGHTESDGYRQFANQKLTNAFLRSTADLGGTTLTILGMGLDMPLAQNPGALSRAQFEANPTQAD